MLRKRDGPFSPHPLSYKRKWNKSPNLLRSRSGAHGLGYSLRVILVFILLTSFGLFYSAGLTFASGQGDKLLWGGADIQIDNGSATATDPTNGYVLGPSSDIAGLINQVIKSLPRDTDKPVTVTINGNGVIYSTIYLGSDIRLILNCSLQLGNEVNRPMLKAHQAHSFEIIGGHLDGNRDNQTGSSPSISGILISSCNDFFIRNVTVINCYHQGVDIVGRSSSLFSHSFTVEGNRCQGNGYDGIYIGFWSRDGTVIGNICNRNGGVSRTTDASGIDVGDRATNITITGNICMENPYNGIRISCPPLESENTACTITNNYVSQNKMGNIVIEYCENTLVWNNTCDGNNITNTGIILASADNSNVQFNTVTGSIFNSIVVHNSTNVVISNNSIFKSLGNGIRVTSEIGQESSNINIQFNIIKYVNIYGIYLCRVNTCSVENNEINGSTNHGLFIESCIDVKVVANSIAGTNGDGINVSSSKNIIIAYNQIRLNGENGISVWVVNDIILANNLISNSGQSKEYIFCNILLSSNQPKLNYNIKILNNTCCNLYGHLVKWNILEVNGENVVISGNSILGIHCPGIMAGYGSCLSNNIIGCSMIE